DTESKNQRVKNFSWNKCLKIVHEKSINYITLKKNIPSLLEATTCFQVSFRCDLPQIGKARFFFLSLFRFACVLNNSTAVI
ncbi:hypothetical protein, partial [Escherichia coli]